MSKYCRLFEAATELDLTINPAFNTFSELPNITSVIYSDKKRLPNVNVDITYASVICHYNSQITKLDIVVDSNVDLSLIGHECRNLEILKCTTSLKTEISEYLMDEKQHFTKLKELDFSAICCSYNCGEPMLPAEIVKVMLSSKSLQSISFTNCSIPDQALSSTIREAKNNEIIFSNLATVSFNRSNFLIETIKSLVCAAPNLKKISMISCNNSVYGRKNINRYIAWFIAYNRLKIEVVFSPKI
jgi:hypothetical protein